MGSKARQPRLRGNSLRHDEPVGDATRTVVFLRGMNLGRRRITNDDLCAAFVSLGFTNVEAFLASGNVIFDAGPQAGDLELRIAEGLQRQLQYDVPCFVRSAVQVRSIAEHHAFEPSLIAESAGKLQVAMLATEPSREARAALTALATEQDRLAFHDRELYWLPSGGVSESELGMTAISKLLGPMTMRTRRTIERIVAKYFAM